MYWQNCFIITDCWGEKAVRQFEPRGFVSMRQNQKLCVIDPGARVSENPVYPFNTQPPTFTGH